MAGIYVHIPFCHSKCAYCDFYSLGKMRDSERLIASLSQEYEMRKSELAGHAVETIYFGGGTPSILPIQSLKKILNALPNHAAELTLEANPEDVNPGSAMQWHEIGFNRISMGAQSMIDKELEIIGRRHNSRQVAEAVQSLKHAGLENFNLDLIYGLPLQTLDSLAQSVNAIIELRPTHISAYSLTFEPGTRLYAMLKRGIITEASDDLSAQMYTLICDSLRQAGYKHYEISNWALPGCHSRHNSNYWNDTPYLGLGPSAHSFDGNIRRANPANLNIYLGAIEKGEAAFQVEAEDEDNVFNDRLITALRTAKGLNTNAIEPHRKERLMSDAKAFLQTGQLTLDSDGFLAFNEQSWLVSDYVLERLIQLSN